ncbi:hypothetical protein J1614_005798, partial [Plenodomus biglobosus]
VKLSFAATFQAERDEGRDTEHGSGVDGHNTGQQDSGITVVPRRSSRTSLACSMVWNVATPRWMLTRALVSVRIAFVITVNVPSRHSKDLSHNTAPNPDSETAEHPHQIDTSERHRQPTLSQQPVSTAKEGLHMR